MSIHSSRPNVTLNQVTTYRWELVAPKGHVMLPDMLFASPYRAEVWLKNYLTTWPNWTYTIKLLEKQ